MSDHYTTMNPGTAHVVSSSPLSAPGHAAARPQVREQRIRVLCAQLNSEREPASIYSIQFLWLDLMYLGNNDIPVQMPPSR